MRNEDRRVEEKRREGQWYGGDWPNDWFEVLGMWSWQCRGGMGCRVCQVCVLWSANLPTVWLQSSWESVQGCLFPAVTFRAVSSAIATFGYTNTLLTIVSYMWNVRQKSLKSACVCLGSSSMSHLMTRPNRQGDSSSLRGGMCFLPPPPPCCFLIN